MKSSGIWQRDIAKHQENVAPEKAIANIAPALAWLLGRGHALTAIQRFGAAIIGLWLVFSAEVTAWIFSRVASEQHHTGLTGTGVFALFITAAFSAVGLALGLRLLFAAVSRPTHRRRGDEK